MLLLQVYCLYCACIISEYLQKVPKKTIENNEFFHNYLLACMFIYSNSFIMLKQQQRNRKNIQFFNLDVD